MNDNDEKKENDLKLEIIYKVDFKRASSDLRHSNSRMYIVKKKVLIIDYDLDIAEHAGQVLGWEQLYGSLKMSGELDTDFPWKKSRNCNRNTDTALRNIQHQQLHKALSLLTGDERDLMELLYFEGRTEWEIAEVCKMFFQRGSK